MELLEELAAAKDIVKLTVSSVVSTPHLKEIYAMFSKACPDIDLILYPTYGADFVPSVIEERSDACVTVYDPSMGGGCIAHAPVGNVASCCLVKEGHVLSKLRQIRIKDLYGRSVGRNASIYVKLASSLTGRSAEFNHLALSEENITDIVAFIRAGGCFIVLAFYAEIFDMDAVVLDIKRPSH